MRRTLHLLLELQPQTMQNNKVMSQFEYRKNDISKRLQYLIENREFSNAIFLATDFLKEYPNEILLKKCLAYCYSMIDNLSDSKELWLEIIQLDPYSEETLLNLAEVERKLGRLDSALGLLELCCNYHPNSFKPWVSMGAIYVHNKNFQECTNASLEAIKRDPTNEDAYQNLGSAFFHLAMFNEAKHAFETALLLNPDIKEAQSSLSSVLFKQGKTEDALRILENLISDSKTSDRVPIEQLKWNAAFPLLRLGQLNKGWAYYEEGLNPNVMGSLVRRPFRSFDVPRWTPDLSQGNRVLIWREQGIGDELIFLTCLSSFINLGFTPIIECDKRLVNILQRSFPGVVAREAKHRIEYPYDSFYKDFDSHIPMGSLMYYLRKSIELFPKRYTYLTPDGVKVAKWRERLEVFGSEKKLIGICWKGGLSDPLRNSKYSNLLQWEQLLTRKDCVFINLQYGDCVDEIIQVQEAFGVKIITWNDLDLKNDLEDIFGLLRNLDRVITISSAIWTFSASIGTPTSLLLHEPHWTMFNQKNSPFFPDVDCQVSNNDKNLSQLIPKVLSNLTKKNPNM